MSTSLTSNQNPIIIGDVRGTVSLMDRWCLGTCQLCISRKQAAVKTKLSNGVNVLFASGVARPYILPQREPPTEME